MEFGLIGKSLEHSFSENYFTEKFCSENLEAHSYRNYELRNIDELPGLIRGKPDLRGLNVTVPYKESVIPFLDELSTEAREIGAVNTIDIKDGKLTGYNTDFIGFAESFHPLLSEEQKTALVLGTGGAAKAIIYALKKLGLTSISVSRTPSSDQVDYQHASRLLSKCFVVINTTPLGTFPRFEEKPPLRLDNVSENHLFYDLVYNPPETRFLREAKNKGARIKNGYEMLVLQAEKSWEIWQHG